MKVAQMLFRFLTSIFKRQPSSVCATINDAYLGTISKQGYGHWTIERRFTGTKAPIEISFHTGGDPPSDEQISFLRKLETGFSNLWQGLRTEVFEDIDDLPDGTTMEQFFDSLEIMHFTFWKMVVEPYEWEIICSTDLDDHLFCIQMLGMNFNGLSVDG